MRQALLFELLLASAVLLPGAASGAGLIDNALAGFPLETVRLEYSSPVKLRALPNYASLRQRYLAPELAKLVSSLSELGVVENDVDEIVLGWRPGARGALELYGFGAGRFNTSAMAQRAKDRGLKPETINGHAAYCLQAGLAASCVVVLEKSLGVFGTLSSLSSVMDAWSGAAPALSSNQRLSALVKSAKTESPIWGTAVGSAAGDWFKGWMPGQSDVQLDWPRVFQSVEALTYSVDARDNVSFTLKLDCASPDAATNLRQVLEGVKLAQQFVWQAQNPNQPNPFEEMSVELADRQVALKVTTAYAALERVSFGTH